MGRPITNTEFFSYEDEVWFRQDGRMDRLQETDTDIVDGLLETISTFYPKAYRALCEEYKGCALNARYYRYRMASRFIRCNFAQLDDVADVSADGRFNFEYVSCPLRGECRQECVICRPEFDHKLSGAEMPVLKLWYEGESEETISARLHLSPHTVHNHIRNAYQRIGVHSRGEFIKYASQNNLFR